MMPSTNSTRTPTVKDPDSALMYSVFVLFFVCMQRMQKYSKDMDSSENTLKNMIQRI